MSGKPRIGSAAHAEAYPDKLSLYNANYDPFNNNRVENFETPWLVDRGWECLGDFATFEEGLAFLLKEASYARVSQ